MDLQLDICQDSTLDTHQQLGVTRHKATLLHLVPIHHSMVIPHKVIPRKVTPRKVTPRSMGIRHLVILVILLHLIRVCFYKLHELFLSPDI